MAVYTNVSQIEVHMLLRTPLIRAASLRFWISRLWDFYLLRKACIRKTHDPSRFAQVARQRALQALVFEKFTGPV